MQGEEPSGTTLSHQGKKLTPQFDPRSVVTVDARLQNNFISKSKGDVSTVAKVTYGPSVCAATPAQNSQTSAPSKCSSRVDSSRYGGVKTYHIDQASAGRPPQRPGPEIGGPFGKLVIIEPPNQAGSAMHTIQRSTTMCQVPMHIVYDKQAPSQV